MQHNQKRGGCDVHRDKPDEVHNAAFQEGRNWTHQQKLPHQMQGQVCMGATPQFEGLEGRMRWGWVPVVAEVLAA